MPSAHTRFQIHRVTHRRDLAGCPSCLFHLGKNSAVSLGRKFNTGSQCDPIDYGEKIEFWGKEFDQIVCDLYLDDREGGK